MAVPGLSFDFQAEDENEIGVLRMSGFKITSTGRPANVRAEVSQD